MLTLPWIAKRQSNECQDCKKAPNSKFRKISLSSSSLSDHKIYTEHQSTTEVIKGGKIKQSIINNINHIITKLT